MKYQKGFAAMTAVIGILVVFALGMGGYVAMNPEVLEDNQFVISKEDDGIQTEPGDHMEVEREANEGVEANQKISLAWRFADAGETDNIPYTNVTAVVNGQAHNMGKFQGSCRELDDGGIDGQGLLAGELSAVQCWFAGGGDEIGIFAHEDGGVDIMTGALSEGIEGGAFFRGDFKVQKSIEF